MDIKTINEIIRILEEERDKATRMDSEGVSEDSLGDTRKPRLVLAVGHSRAKDKGAVSHDGTHSEWSYNRTLAHFINLYLNDNIDVTIIDTYKGDNYNEAMLNLKLNVDPLDPLLVVELHFNSFSDPKANGYEALYWHSSKRGKQAAESFVQAMDNAFPSHTNRGAKAIQDNSERGARFLRTLKAPCVILEPFFGSNPTEWQRFNAEPTGKPHLAKAIALSINKCFSSWGN